MEANLTAMSDAELRAYGYRISGIPSPEPGPDFARRYAAYEVASAFVLAARFNKSLPDIRRRAVEMVLDDHSSSLDMLVPNVERAIGRALDPAELEDGTLYE